jgi:hypothetical protein
MDKPTAPTQVNAMVLVDQLSNKKETRMRYLSRKPHRACEPGSTPCSWPATRPWSDHGHFSTGPAA